MQHQLEIPRLAGVATASGGVWGSAPTDPHTPGLLDLCPIDDGRLILRLDKGPGPTVFCWGLIGGDAAGWLAGRNPLGRPLDFPRFTLDDGEEKIWRPPFTQLCCNFTQRLVSYLLNTSVATPSGWLYVKYVGRHSKRLIICQTHRSPPQAVGHLSNTSVATPSG